MQDFGPANAFSTASVIRVAPTGSKASQNVRYAFNGDRLCASQRTDAMVGAGRSDTGCTMV